LGTRLRLLCCTGAHSYPTVPWILVPVVCKGRETRPCVSVKGPPSQRTDGNTNLDWQIDKHRSKKFSRFPVTHSAVG
jgi:hypothetical protein